MIPPSGVMRYKVAPYPDRQSRSKADKKAFPHVSNKAVKVCYINHHLIS